MKEKDKTVRLRSDEWFFHDTVETRFQHRSNMRSNGHFPESFLGKPVIGIFNSWNDLNVCNAPLKELVEHVKRGVLLGGGYPVEMHTITTAADMMKPSDLPYRNLMSMDVEEIIRSYPIDGAVMLSECDKTTPAQLMATASCNIPTLQLAAGHRASGVFRGKQVNYGTDLWKYMDDYKAGLLNDSDLSELETCISCTKGGCPVMGTASTMKSMSEILGIMLPGTSSIPASHTARRDAAEKTGKRIVEMVYEQLIPSKLMTKASFDNSLKLLAALGGSTNAVLHLTAIAGRLGIKIDLKMYSELSEGIPLLVNVQPSGKHSMDDFYEAGGLPLVIRELLPRLDGKCLTALGKSLFDTYSHLKSAPSDVVGTLKKPFQEESGIRILKGNLAPNGAVLKRAASSRELSNHRGKAFVFDDYEQMIIQLDDDELPVDKNSVLILRNCGPIGAGMPEWGAIPIPRKLLRQGIRDMVRISDARMSGTSYGTIILHVSPEAQIGGALALVKTGDWIVLDVEQGILHLDISEEEMQQRLSQYKFPPREHKRGYWRLWQEHVLQAHEGCDFDFLCPKNPEEAKMISPVIGRG
ncbi:dihydroxy-acid dehydratase [Virgibacillus dakarensis]|uniref:dihydroxy-acid dehydratase n=1 Tax=Virgibacillus dakarensis TaxID=1917889 RepID=UPI000B44EB7A|nr:dihydroxy-acid dehydratase [Virgibacillus dakarensis]